MNYQIAGEHLRYQRKRTDLNETTKSKQLETQIFTITSTKQINKIALPHIVQNFQYSGLDSNDIKYVVKSAKFPARTANIYNGDYVEIYAGYTSYLTGRNPTDGSVWNEKYLINTLPTDTSTYTGVKIYFNTGGQDKVMMNANEIVDNLNEALQQAVAVNYNVFYTTYVYGGLPAAAFPTQFYYDINVYSLFKKMQFVFDDFSGKLGMEVITGTGLVFPLYEIPSAVNIVYDDMGLSTYMLPQGDWGAPDAEYDLAAIQVQVHPGRDLPENRQFRLAQILGGDLSKFTFNLGQLCGSYTEIHSFGKTIAQAEWGVNARGTYPTEFTFTGTNLMDVVPIKQVYIHAGLNSNMWGQNGSKQQYVYVHQMNNTYADNPRHFEACGEYFSAKENVQGLRNGFDVIIKDEFGMDPGFMDQYYLEFAFRFHN